MAIAFNSVGSISGVAGGLASLTNPTTLQFGPDGRLYVTEQNGTINAFTIEIQLGRYVATAAEEINLVKTIQNHNDDGTLFNGGTQARQVTGLLMAGTAANPVIYVTSSDPRISTNADINLDTNSGVLTRLTWTGTGWEAVDLIRGLPRSEENHSVNGMALSPDGTKLYLLSGGNTNNGAPSSFFANTAEYALSAALLEIDLVALGALPVRTDTGPGLNTGRKYLYDLPTLDDPNTANTGVREDAGGMDVAGPWGGRDGLNQAILPSDAPLRVYASGFRNPYDIVMADDGRIYTLDNGSNNGLGGDPILVGGEATNQINNGGVGGGEPLFLVEEGGYYGHPNPTRANQNQSWTVYNNSGTPDAGLGVNTVADISALVPSGVLVADGFLIDPSKFTADAARLAEEGVRILHPGAGSPALVTIGSSSNGLVEYTAGNFEGELQGDILVAQFNGNVARLKLSADGTSATYETIPGLSGLSVPLDVAIGPDGTVWVAEIGGGKVSVFAPTDVIVPGNPDTDGDGLVNEIDPFARDATNGGQAFILPNKTVVWDFDANQDGNRPGPAGYGGGLTGVMIDGVTDYEAFYNGPADFPLQNIRLDNMKFTTAAGGGTTVIENASNGTADGAANTAAYLFHTGATVAPTVDRFTVRLETINPFGELGANSGPNQQIGAYVGTGDQSNFLKLVAIDNGAAGGQIVFSLENDDLVIATSTIDAPGLLDAALNQTIVFEVAIDRLAGTATPTVTYQTSSGASTVMAGTAIALAGSNVQAAINGDRAVGGQTSGLALGLYASNVGQPSSNTFQAIFTDLQVIGEGATDGTALYRVNAGGAAVAATDGGPAWTANSSTDLGPYMDSPGQNLTNSAGANTRDASLPGYVPTGVVTSLRYDSIAQPPMSYAFDVPEPGIYEVRLFTSVSFPFLNGAGLTVFDARVEGVIASAFDNIDPVALFGFREVGMVSAVFEVRDGELNLEFLHDVFGNPHVNGIEILQLATFEQPLATLSIQPPSPATVQELANDGTTALVFPVVFDRAPVSPVTVGYQVTINGVVVVPSGVLSLGFDDGFISVAVPNDAVNNGSEAVVVTLTGITAGANGTDLGQLSAAGTVTEDDTALPPAETVLYRVNAGGGQLAAPDGSGLAWSADTAANPSPYLASISSGFSIYTTNSSTAYKPVAITDPNVSPAVPTALFQTERYDASSAPNMVWQFPVADGTYKVNLYFAELFSGIDAAGERVFDVAVEGAVPAAFDNVDAFAREGAAGGFVLSHTATVTDGTLTLDFLRGTQNPDVSGIEILATSTVSNTPPSIAPIADITIAEGATAAFAVSASDLDGDVIALSVAVTRDSDGSVVSPSQYVFTDTGNGTGSFAWTTDGTDAGAYTVVVTANDGEATATEALALLVEDAPPPNTPPSIAPLDDITIAEGAAATFAVSASDLDGDAITLTVAVTRDSDGTAVDPAEYVFTDTGTGTGSFAWTTDAADAGAYTVTVTANDGAATTTETLALLVQDVPPTGSNILVVRAGGTGTGAIPPQFEVFADGVSLGLRSITAPVEATSFNTQNDALFQDYAFAFSGPAPETVGIRYLNDGTTGGINRNLYVDYIDVNGQRFESEAAGFFTPNNQNPALGGARESLFVNGTLVFDELPDTGGGGTNTPPSIAPLADITIAEGAAATFAVSASDPDGDAIALSVTVTRDGNGTIVNPAEYLFTDAGNGTGSFAWTTDGTDAGAYTVTVTASDGAATATEALALVVQDVPTPQDPLQILQSQGDLFTGASYAPGTSGAAVLRIMEAGLEIRGSNFSPSSFRVENTGDKKIAGIFIDVRGALYPDMVFDPDGKGGDSVAKPWAIDSAGGSGAFVSGSGYFLPGPNPLPNTTGTGQSSNGGFRGAMVKFSNTTDAGFQKGEIVGFSGDMDPNSLAGLVKVGPSGVDTGALIGWDVGGVSGHELIGSNFVVLFDDGTSASGELAGSHTVAGAHAIARQNAAPETAGLTVNGTGPGGIGTYGGTLPTVLATADPGETVRITMTKGFNPVLNTANGIADLVAGRLADDVFKANNAFDVQTVDVKIGPSGVFDASRLFDYDDVSKKITSVQDFPGIDTARIGFVAAVVDTAGGRLPKGPVTEPIYLTNSGGTIVHDAPVSAGYYQGIDGTDTFRFKVQFEDANGPFGQNPPGKWDFFSAPDAAGRQTGFQGTGYYVWGAQTGLAIDGPNEAASLSYTVFIPEGEDGIYSLRVRSSKDSGTPSGSRNDVWVRIDDSAEDLKVNPAEVVHQNGYVKLLGGPTGSWGFGQGLDAEFVPDFPAQFQLGAGAHTITFSGREEGYHLDYWELYKGSNPNLGQANSTFVAAPPPDDFLF